METIIEPTIDFDFSKCILANPINIPGGSFFSRLYINNKPIYIQTPKCITKQGFIKNGKKIYVDLLFNNNDFIFINWIENLETKIIDLIYEKKNNWFNNELEKDEIETAFTSPFKLYKSGKYYLLRLNVKNNIKIYDETNNIIDLDTFNLDYNLISIIEIQGLKFNSRNFQIEFELKQSMIVSPDPFLDNCLIKRNNNKKVDNYNDNDNISLKEFINESVNELNKKKELIEDLEIYSKKINKKEIKENNLDEIENNNKVIKDEVQDNENREYNKNEEDSDISLNTELNSNSDSISISNKDLILLNIEDLSVENNTKNKEIIEVNIDLDNIEKDKSLELKKPEILYKDYINLYNQYKEKAKQAKKLLYESYLEAKKLKKEYDLDVSDFSDGYSENDYSSENEYDNNNINFEIENI